MNVLGPRALVRRVWSERQLPRMVSQNSHPRILCFAGTVNTEYYDSANLPQVPTEETTIIYAFRSCK